MPRKNRNYKKEYAEYHGTAKQKRRRAGRNKARRKMEKEGLVRKGDGKDVHHKDRNPHNSSTSNLQVTSPKKNRGWRRKRGG